MAVYRRTYGLWRSRVLLPPPLSQQSTLRVRAQTHRHPVAQTTAHHHCFLLRAHEVHDRGRQSTELRQARDFQWEVGHCTNVSSSQPTLSKNTLLSITRLIIIRTKYCIINTCICQFMLHILKALYIALKICL